MIRPLTNPVTSLPALVAFRGNLAPDGAVLKAAAARAIGETQLNKLVGVRRKQPSLSLDGPLPYYGERTETAVARVLAGNPVEVLEEGVHEAASKLGSRSQVWADIRRYGHVVHGLSIDELRAAHVG